jgi:hypothetical protein
VGPTCQQLKRKKKRQRGCGPLRGKGKWAGGPKGKVR